MIGIDLLMIFKAGMLVGTIATLSVVAVVGRLIDRYKEKRDGRKRRG